MANLSFQKNSFYLFRSTKTKQNKTKQNKNTIPNVPFSLDSIKAESLLDDQSKLLYKKLSKLSQIL